MDATGKSRKARASRRKGGNYERSLVNWHRDMGIRAERVPLSGGARYQGGGHDIDVYAPEPYGVTNIGAPLCCEAKIRAKLPKCWRDWLGDNDVLFMRDNGGETIVLLPAKTWARMLKR